MTRLMHRIFLSAMVCLCCLSAMAQEKDTASDAATNTTFEIPAWAYDRGNLKTFTAQYADGAPMVANGGHFPNWVEYDIPFPVCGKYTLHVQYAANDSRPLTFTLDGKKLDPICKSNFGSWSTSRARWEEQCTLELTEGKHTLRLENATAFPHVVALKFVSETQLPKDWKLERPGAKTLDQARVAKPAPLPPPELDIEALRRAIDDLTASYPDEYDGTKYLARLDELEAVREELKQADVVDSEAQETNEEALRALRKEALLANPLLNFGELLVIKRSTKSPSLGLTRNWQSNSSLPRSGFDDEIAKLSMADPSAPLETVFRPEKPVFVGDVDLHWDAGRMIFSSIGTDNRWQVFEVGVDGQGLRQLTGEQPDVDNYDACYLPSDKIIFTSTGSFTGVPCVYGNSHVATLYLMDGDGANVRQLSFDQEHNWCPAVLNNGRVLYQRWEYSGLPHSNSRFLFHCNPDGTNQSEYYGSGSYWPNSIFYARPIPGHPTKVVGVIGGHHDNPRMGELYILDPALGRREASGVVQQIPGYGKKKEPVIADGLTKNSWPKFLHPYPLSEKYFLVACKPNPTASWGIYLADTFDNLVLLREEEGNVLFEPVPLRPTKRPPVVHDRVNLAKDDATAFIADIYQGPGLAGVPRGTVKNLRVITYHFSYQNMGGLLGIVGVDGPWDIKQVLGTVPVNEDGSAKFTIPANTPIAFQPLDEDGRALQLMRSWTTAMPGETLQCTGCHEDQSTAGIMKPPKALLAPPEEITPWYGPQRGFSYEREVQPIVDKYCVGCHDGSPAVDGQPEIADLRGDVFIQGYHSISPGRGTNHVQRDAHFSVGYFELQRYCRRPGIESDTHMLNPMEFHAGQTELVQLLEKGHYGVELSDEAWDRINTWIDLNCPYHGTWREATKDPGIQRTRRLELAELYGGVKLPDPEEIYPTTIETGASVIPTWKTVSVETPTIENWPLSAEEAIARQKELGTTVETIQLGEGVEMKMVRVPAGRFVMGSNDGFADERPMKIVTIDKPYWIGALEVTNEQFNCFDPSHDSRVESKHSYQFGIHGYPLNNPEQPVCRVSWQQATAFCEWLSEKTGRKFTLPTEAQWEYAARAGNGQPFFFGDFSTDFAAFANMADARLTGFVTNPYTVDQELPNPPEFDDWIPKESRFNDGAVLTAAPGAYKPNAWGLHDVHGNVAEWTCSEYDEDRKAVRGGSWYDRPKRCTSSFRNGYAPHQTVFNVGFRVVCEE